MMDLQLACILVVGQLTADRTVSTTGWVITTFGLYATLQDEVNIMTVFNLYVWRKKNPNIILIYLKDHDVRLS